MDTRAHCLDEQTLLDHVLGELSPHEREAADEHLRACARCRSQRSELLEETEALESAVDRDVFPSSERVLQARRNLEAGFARYENERQPVVIREPAILDEQRDGFRWARPLAAAAVLVVCLGTAVWFWQTPEALDGSEVLARAQSAESALAAQPVFQRFRVELTQIEPRQEQRAGHLETWSDPAGQRFASRWVDSGGSLQHAVWNRMEDHKVVTSVYDPSTRPEIVTATKEPGAASTLLAVARDGLTTEALAAGLVRWMEARSWQPVFLATGVVELVGENGMRAEVSRPADVVDVLRLTVRRRAGEQLATITLDVNARTYQTVELRIRFESAVGVAEVAMAGEETRVLEAGGFDPVVFEPRVPGLELSASRRIEPAKSSSTDRPKEPAPYEPDQGERLDVSLRILHAIHQAGLCIGRPVNITQQASGIAVLALVNSQQEKADVLDRFLALHLPAWVSAEVQTLAEASNQADTGSASVLVQSPPIGPGPAGKPIAEFRLPIQDGLEKYFQEHSPGAAGGSPRDDQDHSAAGPSGRIMGFANDAVAAAESGLAHAIVVRRLTEEYGGADTALHLSRDMAVVLREMLMDHLGLARSDAERARLLMLPVLEQVAAERGVSATAARTEPPRLTSWREACMHVFGTASRIHGDAVNLLAVNPDAAAAATDGVSNANRALVDLLNALRSIEPDIALASRQVADPRKTFP